MDLIVFASKIFNINYQFLVETQKLHKCGSPMWRWGDNISCTHPPPIPNPNPHLNKIMMSTHKYLILNWCVGGCELIRTIHDLSLKHLRNRMKPRDRHSIELSMFFRMFHFYISYLQPHCCSRYHTNLLRWATIVGCRLYLTDYATYS